METLRSSGRGSRATRSAIRSATYVLACDKRAGTIVTATRLPEPRAGKEADVSEGCSNADWVVSRFEPWFPQRPRSRCFHLSMTIFNEPITCSGAATVKHPRDHIVMHGDGGGGGGGHGGHGGHGGDAGVGGWGGDGGGSGGGGNRAVKIVAFLIVAYVVLTWLGVIGH